MITIRNFRKKALWGLAALLLSVGGYQTVIAQPGISPNFAWLRGAALGSDPALVCQGLDVNVDCNVVPQGTGQLLVNGSPVAVGGGTLSSLTINPGPFNVTGTSNLTGPLNVTGTTSLTGPLFMQPGTSTPLERVGGAVLFNSSADFSPALVATEEDAYSYILPANALSADNQYLKIEWVVSTAANANTKQARLRFGAALLCDTTLYAANAQRWSANVTIWRTGAATQKSVCVGTQTSETAWSSAAGGATNFTTPAETLSGPVTIRVTVQATTAITDVVARGVNMLWYPAGQ